MVELDCVSKPRYQLPPLPLAPPLLRSAHGVAGAPELRLRLRSAEPVSLAQCKSYVSHRAQPLNRSRNQVLWITSFQPYPQKKTIFLLPLHRSCATAVAELSSTAPHPRVPRRDITHTLTPSVRSPTAFTFLQLVLATLQTHY